MMPPKGKKPGPKKNGLAEGQQEDSKEDPTGSAKRAVAAPVPNVDDPEEEPAAKTSRKSPKKRSTTKKSPAGVARPAKASKRRRSSKADRKAGKRSRPLSAYNLFFRDERQRFVDNGVDVLKLYETEVAPHVEKPAEDSKPLDKFQSLVKVVSRRWNQMPKEDRKPYEEMAKEEMANYQARQEQEYRNVVSGERSAGLQDEKEHVSGEEETDTDDDELDEQKLPATAPEEAAAAGAPPDSQAVAADLLRRQQQEVLASSAASSATPSGIASVLGEMNVQFPPSLSSVTRQDLPPQMSPQDGLLLQHIIAAPLNTPAQVAEFLQAVEIAQQQKPHLANVLRDVLTNRLTTMQTQQIPSQQAIPPPDPVPLMMGAQTASTTTSSGFDPNVAQQLILQQQQQHQEALMAQALFQQQQQQQQQQALEQQLIQQLSTVGSAVAGTPSTLILPSGAVVARGGAGVAATPASLLGSPAVASLSLPTQPAQLPFGGSAGATTLPGPLQPQMPLPQAPGTSSPLSPVTVGGVSGDPQTQPQTTTLLHSLDLQQQQQQQEQKPAPKSGN